VEARVILIYLLMALIGAAAAVFAIQNPTRVAVSFLAWQTGGMPLSLVIVLSALVGIVLAAVAGVAHHIRLRLRIRQLEARLAKQPAAAPPSPSPGRWGDPGPPAPPAGRPTP